MVLAGEELRVGAPSPHLVGLTRSAGGGDRSEAAPWRKRSGRRVLVLTHEYPCDRVEHTGPTFSAGGDGSSQAATWERRSGRQVFVLARKHPGGRKKHTGPSEMNSAASGEWRRQMLWSAS
ncbi:Hypothetical predicted protein [Pelobates cultripes]|uniref:Uncharacterized protein n=1 Tax=Pelobates cultripes TaxID=61616 RepID=A0AAD1SS18_PELCU|nr:Hypothetical predicted protein [Pelobates cultripes]